MPYKDVELQRTYMRNWCAQKRAKWLAKMGGKCVKCNSIEELEVDHIVPETKICHRVWSWSEERIASELSKCQLLCAKCHADKTCLEQYGHEAKIKHGTENAYKKYKCRCEICRKFQAEKQAKRRAKGKR